MAVKAAGESAWVARIGEIAAESRLSRMVSQEGGYLNLGAVGRTAKLTQEGLEHIVGRHWAGTTGFAAENTGKFSRTTTLKSLTGMINKTVAEGSIRPNIGKPGYLFELRFGEQIGTTIAGKAAYNLRVAVDSSGGILTAFPY